MEMKRKQASAGIHAYTHTYIHTYIHRLMEMKRKQASAGAIRTRDVEVDFKAPQAKTHAESMSARYVCVCVCVYI